jgi:hypothetical protein
MQCNFLMSLTPDTTQRDYRNKSSGSVNVTGENAASVFEMVFKKYPHYYSTVCNIPGKENIR